MTFDILSARGLLIATVDAPTESAAKRAARAIRAAELRDNVLDANIWRGAHVEAVRE